MLDNKYNRKSVQKIFGLKMRTLGIPLPGEERKQSMHCPEVLAASISRVPGRANKVTAVTCNNQPSAVCHSLGKKRRNRNDQSNGKTGTCWVDR